MEERGESSRKCVRETKEKKELKKDRWGERYQDVEEGKRKKARKKKWKM